MDAEEIFEARPGPLREEEAGGQPGGAAGMCASGKFSYHRPQLCSIHSLAGRFFPTLSLPRLLASPRPRLGRQWPPELDSAATTFSKHEWGPPLERDRPVARAGCWLVAQPEGRAPTRLEAALVDDPLQKVLLQHSSLLTGSLQRNHSQAV